MKHSPKFPLIISLLLALFALPAFAAPAEKAATTPDANAPVAPPTTKRQRNLIKEGNALYRDKRFAEAEVAYRKALEENEMNEVAQYNLAASLLRQAGSADPNNGNSPVNEAQQIMSALAKGAQDASIAERAAYNLGNLAFNAQQYQQSIDLYKSALRRNPDNDQARDNLRLAQLRLQEQQQNQDQNQDQNKDQNQDQQDQDKQDQNKDQNQDQNKDQNKDQDKQDQNKDQQNQQQQGNDKKDQQQQQQQGGISDSNAEKILKAMENAENATRRKIDAKKAKEKKDDASRYYTDKPW